MFYRVAGRKLKPQVSQEVMNNVQLSEGGGRLFSIQCRAAMGHVHAAEWKTAFNRLSIGSLQVTIPIKVLDSCKR